MKRGPYNTRHLTRDPKAYHRAYYARNRSVILAHKKLYRLRKKAEREGVHATD